MAHNLTPDQAAALNRIKAEWTINSYAYGNDFMRYLSTAWHSMQLDTLFGSKRSLLLALGFTEEQLCVR